MHMFHGTALAATAARTTGYTTFYKPYFNASKLMRPYMREIVEKILQWWCLHAKSLGILTSA